VLWRLLAPRPAPVVRYDWFVPDEVTRLEQALPLPPTGRVDDPTWRDMDMPRYVDHLAAELSILGRQVLCCRLRRGATGGLAYTWLQAESQTVREAPALQRAWAALHPLRTVRTELAGPLFGPAPPDLPVWARWLWVLPVALGASLALGAVAGWAAGGLALLATVVVSARAQIALHAPLVQWQSERSALCSLLAADLAVAAVARQAPHARLDDCADQHGVTLRLLHRLRPGWVERLPALADYANLLLLHQYRLLGRQRRALQEELPALQAVFWRVGTLELDLALWRHLRRTPVHCQAQAAGPGCLVLDDVVHPLLAPAHPLSLQLQQRGALVTGQNGVGKSTLLRTVGLNVIVARAFGFCYARRAELASAPAFTVFSSLQVEDSLHTATSLFMAELARAQALVQATHQDSAVLVLVDEIFRGTNPLESVAATAALAKDLSARACLVLATHHLVLAPLLADTLQALCIERGTSGAPHLQPGVLAQTNGLALMAAHGFSSSTQATAATVLAWLQAWMTHPTHMPPLD